jgi:hypothetical protein
MTDSGEKLVVTVISPEEAAGLPVRSDPGVYVVGTGSSGVAETFFVLGVGYFLVMILAAFSYRIPADDWKPVGWTGIAAPTATHKMISGGTVDAGQALKTPQFYLLWIVLCFNVTAGIGVLGVAKTMMTEIFGSTLPQIVTARFAGGFVLAILARHVDPVKFIETFGGSIDRLDSLIANKTVTLARLLAIAPDGTVNPSATLYNSTMYLMAGLLAIACIANGMIRPVDSKHHIAG